MPSRNPYSIAVPPDTEQYYRAFGDIGHEDNPDVPFVPSAMTRYIHPDVGNDLTPDALAAIFGLANQGQTEQQNKLAVEILERNPEILACWQVRVNTMVGVDWACEGNHCKEADEFLKRVPGNADRGLLNFRQFMESAGNALLPGFCCHETCWLPGGADVEGWYRVPEYYFTHRFFPGGTSFNNPLLIRETQGFIRQSERLTPAEKWVIHRSSIRSGDPARGGLIRPLAWLHLLHLNMLKFGARYAEKYCSPFLLAQIALSDKVAFEEEVRKLKLLLSNMGTDSGAIFSNNTTVTPMELQGTGNTIYGQMLGILTSLINKLMLGQTSTTTAENSNRSIGQVHNIVRHDLLVGDCRALECTVNAQILAPWHRFKYGEGEPPKMVFDVTPFKDAAAVASLIKDLSTAGLEPEDLEEVSRIVGIKVKKAPKPEVSASGFDAKQKSGEVAK